MIDKRYISRPDTMNDCISLIDTLDELKNEFDSEIVLYPMEDAEIVVDKLNFYELLVKRLCEHLEYYGFGPDDVKDVIEDVRCDLE